MNILITSVGRRSYIVSYFKNALNGIGHVHASNSENTYALNIADKSVITPLIYNGEYIDFLITYCKENNITAILSLFDIDLPILAKNKYKFEEIGVKVIVPDYETTQICNDKWKTYHFLIENGFKTTKCFIHLDECKEEYKNNNISFPLLVKPRWGMGSNGIHTAYSIEELEVLYNKTKQYILNSYLKYEAEPVKEECVLIQQNYGGQEYGIDVFNGLDANFLTCIGKRKLAMRAGETDIAEIIDDEKLYELGKSLSTKLKHIANLDVDCFKIGDEYYIVDMNCRFGGQYPFCHLAGANFPEAIVNMLQSKPVEKELLCAEVGVIGIKDINPVRFG